MKSIEGAPVPTGPEVPAERVTKKPRASRKKQAEPKAPTVEEVFTPEQREAGIQAAKEAQTPRVTKKFIEDRRIKLEEDTWLTKQKKKEIEDLIDELEEIHIGLKEKKYSVKEIGERRDRQAHLVRQLRVGSEMGITEDEIEEVRAIGMRDAEVRRAKAAKAKKRNAKPKREKTAKERVTKGEVAAAYAKIQEAQDAKKEIPTAYEAALKRLAEVDVQESLASVAVAEGIALDENHDGLTEKLSTEEGVFSESDVFEKMTDEEQVEAALETVPAKERPTWLRKLAGAGFALQEAKNAFGEKAFGFAYEKFFKKTLQDKAEGEDVGDTRFNSALLMRSLANHYASAKEQSRQNREDFYAGKSKKSAWAQLAGEGIRATRAVFAPFNMLRSPVWALMAMGRISETASDVRLEKKKWGTTEDEAAEEAWYLYQRAEKSAREQNRAMPTADDIRREYVTRVAEGTFEAYEGTIATSSAGMAIKKLIEPMYVQLQEIQANTTLTSEERETQLNALAQKHEKMMHEIDALVDQTGKVDAVAYYLKRSGVWTKRVATVLAIETLAEAGWRIAQLDTAFHISPDTLAEAHEYGAAVNHAPEYAPDVAGALSAEEAQKIVTSVEGVSEAPEVPASVEVEKAAPVIIEKGGNIWSAAKEVFGDTGLPKEQFAEAWSNSTVALADGREIPLAELHLVHEGDTLSYVAGENGAVGHFEFNNESHIAYGDALNLPGAHEATPTFDETVDVEPRAVGVPEEALETIDTPREVRVEMSDMYDAASEASTESYTEPLAREMHEKLQNFFGDYTNERASSWHQWKDMGARKFMRLALGDDTLDASFQKHLEYLQEQTGSRPRGGFWQKNETVEAYLERATAELLKRKE